jgi:hypothetical protein
MKNIIILCASVLGVVQGVATEGEKTLLVGVRPHEFAKRDYYKKLAPNTRLWVLSDSCVGRNTDEESRDFEMGVVNFSGKKVGFNGVTDDDLDHVFSDVYDQKPSSKTITSSLMNLDQRTTLSSDYKKLICNRIRQEKINHDQIVNWAKNLQSAVSDDQPKPMIMYGMPFVEEGDLTEEGQKHKDKFDTVIVDQNVFKYLAGFVGFYNDIDRAERVEKTTKVLSELLCVGGDLIILNPGGGLTHPLESSVKGAFSSMKGIMFDDVSI